METPSPGLTEVEFYPSVSMSTYVVGFIVSDFIGVNATLQNGKPLTLYSRRSQVNNTGFALDLGVDISNYLEDYLRVKFPLPKQGEVPSLQLVGFS